MLTSIFVDDSIFFLNLRNSFDVVPQAMVAISTLFGVPCTIKEIIVLRVNFLLGTIVP